MSYKIFNFYLIFALFLSLSPEECGEETESTTTPSFTSTPEVPSCYIRSCDISMKLDLQVIFVPEIFIPVLHTAWLNNHALTLKRSTAKYYFGEKSSFLHTFL
jgi:hypothetical protein